MNTILLNVIDIERLDLRFDNWNELHVVNNNLKEYSKQSRIKWLKLSFEGLHTTTKDDLKALIDLNAVQPIHSLKIFLYGPTLPLELPFISQLKLATYLDIYHPSEYSNQNELLAILSEQLPNLQNLRINLNGTQLVFKDVAMQFIRHSVKMKNLTFIFCCPTTFIFQPNDLITFNHCRLSIYGACAMKIRLDYFTDHENFEKPAFIHPACSVLSIQFTGSFGSYEL